MVNVQEAEAQDIIKAWAILLTVIYSIYRLDLYLWPAFLIDAAQLHVAPALHLHPQLFGVQVIVAICHISPRRLQRIQHMILVIPRARPVHQVTVLHRHPLILQVTAHHRAATLAHSSHKKKLPPGINSGGNFLFNDQWGVSYDGVTHRHRKVGHQMKDQKSHNSRAHQLTPGPLHH